MVHMFVLGLYADVLSFIEYRELLYNTKLKNKKAKYFAVNHWR